MLSMDTLHDLVSEGHRVATQQGLTKARLERDLMALGVFPNWHECQKNRFSGFEKTFAIY